MHSYLYSIKTETCFGNVCFFFHSRKSSNNDKSWWLVLSLLFHGLF